MARGAGSSRGTEDRRLRLYGGIASVVLVAVAVVLAIVGGGGGGEAPVDTAPRLVDAADLRQLEDDLGHPVYWAGERPPARLELKREASGNVFVRYLPPGAPAGDRRRGFLTVGTYPVADAVAVTRRFARGAGARVLSAAGGAVVVPNPDSRGSVYLAHPGADLQVEVYDPAPGRSLRLIQAGSVAPVGGG